MMTSFALLFGVLLDAVIPSPSAATGGFAAEAGSGIQPHSAVFHAREQRLQLQPTDGADVEIRVLDPRCAAGATPPAGLWMVTRDGDGQPHLLAPSATSLPPGHGGQIRLAPCGQRAGDDAPQLVLPEPVIDLLADRAGLVLIAD